MPKLTDEQNEQLCLTAEEAARKYILSNVSSKRIEKFDITVEFEGAEPLVLSVEVDLVLSPLMKDVDVQKLVDEAVKEAFKSAEKFLEELKCHSQKY